MPLMPDVYGPLSRLWQEPSISKFSNRTSASGAVALNVPKKAPARPWGIRMVRPEPSPTSATALAGTNGVASKYRPAGSCSVPPPAVLRALMLAWRAALLSVPHVTVASRTVVLAALESLTVVAETTAPMVVLSNCPAVPAPLTPTSLPTSDDVHAAVVDVRVALPAVIAPSPTLRP